jgi:hypothetical protein
MAGMESSSEGVVVAAVGFTLAPAPISPSLFPPSLLTREDGKPI